MKFYYYVVILVGMMIILNAAGMSTPSGDLAKTFNVMNATGGNLENFKDSDLWNGDSNSLRYLLIGLIGAGLVLGAFGRTPDIRYITAGFIFVFGGLIVADLIFLYTQLNSYGITWISWIALSVFGALSVGFFVTAIEFWQGASD